MDLGVPAQQRDPENHEHEEGEELGPLRGQEPAFLDPPMPLDVGLSARFLQPDQPEVAAGWPPARAVPPAATWQDYYIPGLRNFSTMRSMS